MSKNSDFSTESYLKIYKIDRIDNFISVPVYIDNANFKKFIEFGKKLFNNQLDKREKLFLNLSPNIFDNGKLKILYLTNTQIKKLNGMSKFKYNNQNPFLKNILFSRNQINKTFSKVMEINSIKIRDKNLEQKNRNLLRRKYKKNKNLITLDDNQAPVGDLITFDDDPVGDLIDFKTKIPNPKVIPSYGRNDQLEKKLNKINLDIFVKNSLKKYKEPKPKKKSIWDVIEFPKPLVI